MGRPSVLVVGLGSIGRRHLRCLRSCGIEELRAFRPVGRTLLAPDVTAGVTFFESLHDALSDPPDAVVVATPTTEHVATAEAALSAGCHVLVEKPVSHTVDGVAALQSRADRDGLALTVGYQTRFHPGFRRLRRLLDAGRIGRALCVRAEVGQYLPDWHPEEDYRTGVSARRDLGGGVLLDLSHEIDYVTALFGPAESVIGFVGRVSALEIETEDLAELVLECATVPVASIRLDYLQRAPTRRCQVIGEAGTLEWNYLDASVSLFGPAGLEERWDEPGFERQHMYEAQMAHFLRCVAGEASPEVTLDQALHSLEVIAAADAAARSGRRQTLGGPSTTGGTSLG